MGHLDELVIVDSNYSDAELCKKRIYTSIDHNEKLLSEILKFFPIDDDRPNPITMMAIDFDTEAPPFWDLFQNIVNEISEKHQIQIAKISREDFYTQAKRAYVAIKTSDIRLYGNIIIRKGVVLSEE
jgi:Fucose dissimilation pathway protein FucU